MYKQANFRPRENNDTILILGNKSIVERVAQFKKKNWVLQPPIYVEVNCLVTVVCMYAYVFFWGLVLK